MRGLAAAAIVVLLLAGCQAKPAAGPSVSSDPGKGAVQGVAVSAAIVPLAGVGVRLEPAGRNATTDTQGRFAFDNVAPGAYTLLASKAGYLGAQTTVQVEAGPAGPLVRLQLEADTSSGQYVEAYAFEGIVDDSFNVVGARGNSGSTTAHYNISARAPDFIQSELVWDSTQQFGSDLDLTAVANDGNTTIPDFAEVEGASPLLMKVNTTLIQQYHLGPRIPMELWVFSGQAQEPVPGRGVGVAVSQRFTIYTHMFYGYLPPDTWRFTTDGDPPPPA
jgi:hypothetical protein